MAQPTRTEQTVRLPVVPDPPPPGIDERFFPGFTRSSIQTTGATINMLRGGEGPPLLLLHGHPETHVAWHKVAGERARDYTVVLPDLRGYGDSSKPDPNDQHADFRPRQSRWMLFRAVLRATSLFCSLLTRGAKRGIHRNCNDRS